MPEIPFINIESIVRTTWVSFSALAAGALLGGIWVLGWRWIVSEDTGRLWACGAAGAARAAQKRTV